MSLCHGALSVHPSVCLSVRLSFCPSVLLLANACEHDNAFSFAWMLAVFGGLLKDIKSLDGIADGRPRPTS